VLHKAMSILPEDRYQSVAEFKARPARALLWPLVREALPGRATSVGAAGRGVPT
jgi:hypothetical protein